MKAGPAEAGLAAERLGANGVQRLGGGVPLLGHLSSVEDTVVLAADEGLHCGMGDIVALVEKAAAAIDAEQARKAAERMAKGKFDLQDLCDQLAQVEKIGGLGGIMGLLPGVAKMKDQISKTSAFARGVSE